MSRPSRRSATSRHSSRRTREGPRQRRSRQGRPGVRACNREGLDRLAEDDWRRNAPPFQEPKLSQNLALVERLEPIAARLDTTVASLARAWVLAVPGVTGAIVGGRRPSQLDDWLGADDVELNPETLAGIEDALEATGAGTDEPQQPPVAVPS